MHAFLTLHGAARRHAADALFFVICPPYATLFIIFVAAVGLYWLLSCYLIHCLPLLMFDAIMLMLLR